MKEKFLVMGSALLVFSVGFFSYQWVYPDNAFSHLFQDKGDMRIESRPAASVFIDNRLVGQTPLQLSLQDGVYTVKIVPGATKEKTYMTWSDKVRVYADATTYVNRVLAVESRDMAGEMLRPEKSGSTRGQMLLNTEPSGLFISLDGDERGLSPLFIDNIPSGDHEITVQGEGLLPRTIKVRANDGYKILVDVTLAIDRQYVEKKKKQQQEKKRTEDGGVKGTVTIADTPTGWLRVRFEPSLNASESAKIDVGKEVPYFQEQDGWYEVEYEKGKRGWISADYARVNPQVN